MDLKTPFQKFRSSKKTFQGVEIIHVTASRLLNPRVLRRKNFQYEFHPQDGSFESSFDSEGCRIFAAISKFNSKASLHWHRYFGTLPQFWVLFVKCHPPYADVRTHAWLYTFLDPSERTKYQAFSGSFIVRPFLMLFRIYPASIKIDYLCWYLILNLWQTGWYIFHYPER